MGADDGSETVCVCMAKSNWHADGVVQHKSVVTSTAHKREGNENGCQCLRLFLLLAADFEISINNVPNCLSKSTYVDGLNTNVLPAGLSAIECEDLTQPAPTGASHG